MKKSTLKCLCLILDTFFECLEREIFILAYAMFLFSSYHRICQNENENNPMKIQYLHKNQPSSQTLHNIYLPNEWTRTKTLRLYHRYAHMFSIN